MVKIYNTMTGRKEPFEPLVPGTAKMYVCGVTVYDECHLGHARSALVFDVIRRYLEASGLTVTLVKNFTDIDDKIIHRAQEQGILWQMLTARYIDAYHRDMRRLGVQPATVEPKATEHIGDIIALVQTLLRKGIAYQAGEDVYFQVEKFPAYGALSKRKLDEMQAGARVEVDERKRHPMDFVLWKGAKPDEPAWDSPWGAGRPGWHIECSAMSIKHLGETFDIHGGGADLIFPHHENEIAQSSGATGKEFARYWVHNGFVQINQEKMSKSLGNFFTVREIFEKCGYREAVTGEVLRYFLLATHYRSPLDFSDEGLKEAKRALDGIYDLFVRLQELSEGQSPGDIQLKRSLDRSADGFRQAMDEDFNTPAALAQLQQLRSEVNRLLENGLSHQAGLQARDLFRRYGATVGLFQLEVYDWQFNPFSISVSGAGSVGLKERAHGKPVMEETDIQKKIDERNEARRMKDFRKADEIRAELTAAGITIEDRPDGTSRWKR
jgi:cysteinyl-tRNA synthetase